MLTKPLFGVILTLCLGVTALAAPQENIEAHLSRTATTDLQVRTELSLNIYRQEPYQAEYTVQVPYDVQETYYVDVPYQTTETYYENVPYTERVPYTDYEDYYDNEYVCRNVTRYREECHNERVCAPGGRVCQPITECGTNARGEKVCKTRNECRDDGPRECRDIPKCSQVPYQDRQCNYESVRKSRPVTRYRDEVRYRQELRTRTVTKYRQEARTRTVTKYRDENRCCVTKYRDIFDHQFTQPVAVIFPTEAALQGTETESLHLTLSGDQNTPQVRLSVNSNIFNYEVAEERFDGREKVFVLKLLPKWTLQNAGAITIKDLKLVFTNGQAAVQFGESVASPRLVTTYSVQIRDQQSQTLVGEAQVQNQEARGIQIPFANLSRENKYDVHLLVERQGSNVAGGSLSFELSTTYEKKELDAQEIQDLRKEGLVQLVGIEGTGENRGLLFKDLTPSVDEVHSTYKLVVWKKLSTGKIEWLGEKAFPREPLSRGGSDLAISFKAVGVNPPQGQKLYFDLVVNRTSDVYLRNQKVQFIVSKTF